MRNGEHKLLFPVPRRDSVRLHRSTLPTSLLSKLRLINKEEVALDKLLAQTCSAILPAEARKYTQIAEHAGLV